MMQLFGDTSCILKICVLNVHFECSSLGRPWQSHWFFSVPTTSVMVDNKTIIISTHITHQSRCYTCISAISQVSLRVPVFLQAGFELRVVLLDLLPPNAREPSLLYYFWWQLKHSEYLPSLMCFFKIKILIFCNQYHLLLISTFAHKVNFLIHEDLKMSLI